MDIVIQRNVKVKLDADIYGEEYARITGEMKELRQQRSAFTQGGV